MQGFSARNLRCMRQFVENYPDSKMIKTTLSQISWSHNIVLISKVKNLEEREWYINKCIENGWSRTVMIHQIETGLYNRVTNEEKTHNFPRTLPPVQSELAVQTLKDPFIFDFLTLTEDYKEKDIETELVKHITKFLLELRSRICFYWKTISFRNRGYRLLHRFIILSFKIKMLCSNRIKKYGFYTRICRKIKFLPIGSR